MADYSINRTIQSDAMLVSYRARYRKLLASDKSEDKLDEDLVPFLNRLNRVRGISTVSSCSGHEIDGVYQDFYVSCIVNREGVKNLIYLVDSMNQSLALGKYRNKTECRYVIDIRLGVFTIRMNSDWKTYKKDFLFLLRK